ncbi:microcystin-dependent protein [Deinobacterium chartae]|uniref:Microcystin-dependent protein n=1 Tax=Deinobacterium chartae TaxID=521158 RepID=A0A841I683_9DEIO|nr:tail fiber protein [Deinobacterium chartae]MBB6099988.1 microcystin-dependent protein [Deinobacterium chartae]
MTLPYIGEIRMFAGNFAPQGWLMCEGQLLPISENEALFQLIGTTYGGDGTETFALPDLRGRVPVHMGTSSVGTHYLLGSHDGVETVTLTPQQIPVHHHYLLGTSATGTTPNPGGSLLATNPGSVRAYIEDVPSDAMAHNSLGPVGGSQPHENLQPYLCINFIIAEFGIFPSPY